MSKIRYTIRKKGVNYNKPLKRERDRRMREFHDLSDVDEEMSCIPDKSSRIDKSSNPERSNKRELNRKERPPPGLKGKEIGLWYRDRNRKQQVKPVPLVLNKEKREKIEKVLELAGTTVGTDKVKDEKRLMKEGAFKRSFLDKISVSFEEKLNRAENVKIQPDEQLDSELYNELCKKKGHNPQYKAMFEFRQTLPSYKKRKEIVDLIGKNQIIVISGETGCGKTTQIVQYALDDYILKNKGSTFNAVCTQPRRISAISVAERVAAERAEKIGESIGYVIRLENVMPKKKKGSITFVTTGVLIQWLHSDPSLKDFTHLFIDEIHERDTLCDFLLTLLKSILPKRPDLRVILMSATLNAQQFSNYYGGIPCVEIPGFTYPIEDFYLEDIMSFHRFRFTFFQATTHFKIKTIDPDFYNYILPRMDELGKSGEYSPMVVAELKNPYSEILNLDLMAEVIRHICINESDGAILVFVPGLSQIQNLHKILTSDRFFSPMRYIIIPMHSIMPTINQRKAFERPPKGVRKIVISTSIAETSITIDDVVFVIDSGRQKTKNFDLERNVSTLEPEWETLANARQRRGRAGRTQPGKCYKLFTSAREEIFESYPIPEMKRSRLEEVILSAKFLQLGKVEPFLEKVMDPPDPVAVKLSLKMLRTLNVLDSDEKLTPLGFHLAKLPLDPQTGKMILMGALFSCLDPILSIAACLNFKDPFVFVLGKEKMIRDKQHVFARGEKSDHFMLSEAIKCWEEANNEGYGKNYAFDNFLSHHNLVLLCNMKKQFARHLYNMKFIASDDPKFKKSNINSHRVSLIKAIVCSGLYPNVAMIGKQFRKKSTNTPGRTLWKTVDHNRVELHAKSLLENKQFESPFLVYYKIIKSSSIFIHDATEVYPMALLFFGEKLEIIKQEDEYIIRIDEMIKFPCIRSTAEVIQKLRNELVWILESAISNPGVVDWEKESKQTLILEAIVELISSEDKTQLINFG